MNWDRIEGKWEQAKGRFKQQWSKLTDDDLAQIRGRKDELIGKIRERYGEKREDIERRIDELIASM